MQRTVVERRLRGNLNFGAKHDEDPPARPVLGVGGAAAAFSVH